MRYSLIKIENDLFDISNRVKQIDESYYIVFNKSKKRYEVHSSRQNPTLAVVVPYLELDYRTISLVINTKTNRLKDIIKEMELFNLNLENNKNKLILNNALQRGENEN